MASLSLTLQPRAGQTYAHAGMHLQNNVKTSIYFPQTLFFFFKPLSLLDSRPFFLGPQQQTATGFCGLLRMAVETLHRRGHSV